MQKRARYGLLIAIFLALGAVAFFVHRPASTSQAAVLKRALLEDEAFLDAKVPQIVVSGVGERRGEGYKKEYQFRTDWFTARIPPWEKVLGEFKGKPDIRYLEVGLFEGRSFFWVLDNILTDPTSKLTGVDPFLEWRGAEGFKDIFFANLKLSGAEDRATIVTGFSQDALRKLPLDSFDIIYIDGSHDAADVLEDAILSHRLLKLKGVLIFDDYLLHRELPPHQRPKPAIDTFYAFYKDHYDVLHNDGYQVFMRKKRR